MNRKIWNGVLTSGMMVNAYIFWRKSSLDLWWSPIPVVCILSPWLIWNSRCSVTERVVGKSCAELAALSQSARTSHTTGRTARMFLVAGSEKLKLMSSNKTCQGWVAMFWLIQQFSVIITDPHSFFLFCYLQYVVVVLTLASIMVGKWL